MRIKAHLTLSPSGNDPLQAMCVQCMPQSQSHTHTYTSCVTSQSSPAPPRIGKRVVGLHSHKENDTHPQKIKKKETNICSHSQFMSEKMKALRDGAITLLRFIKIISKVSK